jgi:hypothetical protein
MSHVIAQIWKRQPGDYFCLSTRSPWRDHFFTRDEFGDLAEFIAEHARDDVYWCPHGLSRKSRLADAAVGCRMLWADLDAVDPRSLRDRPTVAWETSPGRYAALWALDDVPTLGLRKAFNDAIGADRGGWCLSKVLRVPGTRNHKYRGAPVVKLLWEKGATHELDDLVRRYGADERAAGRNDRRASVMVPRMIADKHRLRMICTRPASLRTRRSCCCGPLRGTSIRATSRSGT